MRLYFGTDEVEVDLIKKITSKVRVNFMKELSNLKNDPKTGKIIELVNLIRSSTAIGNHTA